MAIKDKFNFDTQKFFIAVLVNKLTNIEIGIK